MSGGLAPGDTAVVAGITGSGAHRIGRGMGKYHRQPTGSGSVAAFAVGYANVHRCVGARHGWREIARVATGALRADRHIAVKARRRPCGEPATVAGVAIGYSNTTKRLVWNVVGWPAIGWGKCAAVAG